MCACAPPKARGQPALGRYKRRDGGRAFATTLPCPMIVLRGHLARFPFAWLIWLCVQAGAAAGLTAGGRPFTWGAFGRSHRRRRRGLLHLPFEPGDLWALFSVAVIDVVLAGKEQPGSHRIEAARTGDGN